MFMAMDLFFRVRGQHSKCLAVLLRGDLHPYLAQSILALFEETKRIHNELHVREESIHGAVAADALQNPAYVSR